ncbi:MAG TPA: NAD(P)-dependent alcohol dehydrogenase [Vicinamibacterales bacterium]
MKAITYRAYGSPDVLEYEDVEQPSPGDDDVLLRVRAASVNPRDWHFMRGEPYFVRMMTGLSKSTAARLGTDVAGQVEAVGKNVRQFKAGDEVFGWCRAALAEYALATHSAVVGKPAAVTFDQAACVATAGLTALQALRDKGGLRAGQKVLINGAAGGVGTFAVQIARSFGADVTGVCSTRNLDLVGSIGAGRVIDYTRQDFTAGPQRYDLILDSVGNHSMLACKRALSSGGTYVAVGGPSGRGMIGPLSRVIAGPLLSRVVNRRLTMHLTRPSQADLVAMRDFMEAGKVTPVVDRRYRLSEAAEAIRYLEQGHARGKVVITVE